VPRRSFCCPKMSDDLLIKIGKIARSRMTIDNSSHDWAHVERVNLLANKLGASLGADLMVLGAASLLHDIGMEAELERGDDHAKAGAEIAEEILSEVHFPEDRIRNVVNSIRTHRYGGRLRAETLEAMILQDADRLDAIGAIGLARAFAYGGARGCPIYDPLEVPGEYDPSARRSTVTHIKEKLLRISDSLNTEAAREIAFERERFLKLFLDRLLAEFRGEA
jgi:uncharacterized protein